MQNGRLRNYWKSYPVKTHLTLAVQSRSTFNIYSQSSLASGFPITLTSFLTSGSINLGPNINIPQSRNWQKQGILKRQVFPTSAYTQSLLIANEKITHTTSVLCNANSATWTPIRPTKVDQWPGPMNHTTVRKPSHQIIILFPTTPTNLSLSPQKYKTLQLFLTFQIETQQKD